MQHRLALTLFILASGCANSAEPIEQQQMELPQGRSPCDQPGADQNPNCQDGGFTPPGPGTGGNVESNCVDGADDDRDGLVDCADTDCNGVICRGVAGDCDAEEVCAAGTCPVDSMLAAGTECRAAIGACDITEVCSGVVPDCPPDVLEPAGTQCRPAVDACDQAEGCTGTDPTCPVDGLVPEGALCRAAIADCDAPESCTGTSSSCPSDTFLAAGTLCRGASGACDTVAEFCDGGPACPADANGCAETQFCNGISCVEKRTLGLACSAHYQCASGHCYDGVCCDAACDGSCRACNLLATPGICVNRPAGTDPEGGCGAYACDGSGSCSRSCSGSCSSAGCDSTAYCSGGTCLAQRADGASCTADCQCSSGFCVDGVCCNSRCTGPCRSCIAAGPAGTCSNYPLGHPGDIDDGGCGNYTCDGTGSCFTSCSGDLCSEQCKNRNAWCEVVSNTCVADFPAFVPCLIGCQCQSNSCTGLFGCSPVTLP
jgi:hypothetical protein